MQCPHKLKSSVNIAAPSWCLSSKTTLLFVRPQKSVSSTCNIGMTSGLAGTQASQNLETIHILHVNHAKNDEWKPWSHAMACRRTPRRLCRQLRRSPFVLCYTLANFHTPNLVAKCKGRVTLWQKRRRR